MFWQSSGSDKLTSHSFCHTKIVQHFDFSQLSLILWFLFAVISQLNVKPKLDLPTSRNLSNSDHQHWDKDFLGLWHNNQCALWFPLFALIPRNSLCLTSSTMFKTFVTLSNTSSISGSTLKISPHPFFIKTITIPTEPKVKILAGFFSGPITRSVFSGEMLLADVTSYRSKRDRSLFGDFSWFHEKGLRVHKHVNSSFWSEQFRKQTTRTLCEPLKCDYWHHFFCKIKIFYELFNISFLPYQRITLFLLKSSGFRRKYLKEV